jgi:hypothetical protein
MNSSTIKSLSFALGTVMALSLSACGASDQASAPAPTESASATDVVATDTTDEPEVVEQFVFTNTGTAEICELYLSPVEEDEWGPDQLEEQTILAGEDFILKNIPAGTYDAKAVGCDDAGEVTIQLDITNQ